MGDQYFNGVKMIRKKVRHAIERGMGGVMIWEVGQDCRVQEKKTGDVIHVQTCKSKNSSLLLAITNEILLLQKEQNVEGSDVRVGKEEEKEKEETALTAPVHVIWNDSTCRHMPGTKGWRNLCLEEKRRGGGADLIIVLDPLDDQPTLCAVRLFPSRRLQSAGSSVQENGGTTGHRLMLGPLLANQFIVNDENHEAAHGIDGDMINVNWIAALTSAHTKEELEEALDGLEKEKNVVDKVSLVMGGMSKKKSNKNLWTSDIDLKFKQLCKAL